ncbi:DUF6271 family protein [Streptomyces sioyaensis]|uniref:DUF6271 family protein n=1 Tax=Streptomyces sioyaensis TaxID=67364 RepID=UPI0037CCF318
MNTPVAPEHGKAPDAPVTRLVYIPTNRPFEAAFRSVAAEVTAARRVLHEDVRLLVIDDCSAETSRKNRAVVEHAARKHGCDVHVLTPDGWQQLADEIVTAAALSLKDTNAARSALVKPSGSYGAGPNKAALIAAYVGAASLHRRDSDQLTGVDPRSGWSPLHVESRLLGGVAHTSRRPASSAYCVGSSLTGEPTRDRRDLQHNSPDAARRIDDLSRLSPAEARPRHANRTAPVPARTTVGDCIRVERDLTGSVEMGIAALHTVYEWIPEMPAVGILGSDYFQKGLLYQLDLPVFHHQLRAHHVYEDWRTEQRDPQHLGWYALAELRYSLLRYHWNAFNEQLKSDRDQLLSGGGSFDSAAYGEWFVDTVRRGAQRAARLPHEYIAVYKEVATTARGDVRDRIDIRIAALEAEADSSPAYVAAAISEFASLTRLWPALTAAAGRVGLRHGRRLPI